MCINYFILLQEVVFYNIALIFVTFIPDGEGLNSFLHKELGFYFPLKEAQ